MKMLVLQDESLQPSVVVAGMGMLSRQMCWMMTGRMSLSRVLKMMAKKV